MVTYNSHIKHITYLTCYILYHIFSNLHIKHQFCTLSIHCKAACITNGITLFTVIIQDARARSRSAVSGNATAAIVNPITLETITRIAIKQVHTQSIYLHGDRGSPHFTWRSNANRASDAIPEIVLQLTSNILCSTYPWATKIACWKNGNFWWPNDFASALLLTLKWL